MTGEIIIGEVQQPQQEVLDAWLADAREFGIDIEDLDSIGEAFDEHLLAVMEQEPDDRQDPTAFCTMVGMAMGEYLARNSDLRWRIITDDEGTDLGLANPEETGVLFPADPVAGAWQEQSFGWLPVWVGQLMQAMQVPEQAQGDPA